MVLSNCKGRAKKVTYVSDGGPFWPKAIPAPASVPVCESTASPTPTTVASSDAPTVEGDSLDVPGFDTGSTDYSSDDSTGYADTSSADSSTTDEIADGGSGGPSGTADGGTTGDPTEIAVVAAQLPLPAPNDGRYVLDRLATLMMGGVAFLLLRRILGSRMAS